MFIKLGIIGAILIAAGFIFSSEINTLFPNTSTSVVESLKSDVSDIGIKTTQSVENRVEKSLDNIIDKTNEKINYGINDVRQSSSNLISNQLTDFNPIESIKNTFQLKT